jgi:hypothetical protein
MNGTESNRHVRRALILAGVSTAIIDGTFSSVLSVAAYHSTVSRLFQGVAAVPFGAQALEGGTRFAAIGIAMHIAVAFAWSAVFLFVYLRSAALRNLTASTFGIGKAAVVFGPLVWTAMSLAVVPTFTHRLPPITIRWWIQFVGHAPFVGLPIVTSIARTVGQRIDRRPATNSAPPTSSAATPAAS